MTEKRSVPEKYPDVPPGIESLEELVTRGEFARQFNISEHTIDQWRYGRGGIEFPLPYIRWANRIYLWRGGIIWWLNKQIERPDFYHLDRMKRNKKGAKVGKAGFSRDSK